MTTEAIPFASIPWSDKQPHLRVKSVIRGRQRFRLVRFGLGYVESGWCETGHVGYLIEGEIEIAFEDGIRTFKQGDGLAIPDGVPHRHHATLQEATAFLVERFG